tara:strand:+ start:1232 stop:2539 length:1308 start_codon:yes stop_codon:yes gene_type:complete
MKKISIIGSGYVGLVSGAGLSEFGNYVTCLDIDKTKINKLKKLKIPIFEPGLENIISKNMKKGLLNFSSDISGSIKDSEIVFIAVGTPQNHDGSANIEFVESVAETIADNLNNYKIICTKSTVPIGTGKKIKKLIEKSSNSKNFDYVSNPEFLREGAAIDDFLHPDRIIIGCESGNVINAMKEVYRPLYLNETPMLFTNVETSEMIKYASNSFLATKISFINEIANLSEKVGADVHHVSKAMGLDGRISPKFLHPGPGFGGSCFPKDTRALAHLGKENDVSLKIINAVIETNDNQRIMIFEKIKSLCSGSLENKTISILGLSFKPETDDIRESPAKTIIPLLIENGANVNVYDPIAMLNFKKEHLNINYFNNWRDCVYRTDVCAVLVEWNEFRGIDLKELKKLLKQPRIVDAKNIFSIEKLKAENFSFENVGRKL